MAKKIDPRDFYINTDYEMDKIILYKTGELNIGDYYVTIPHNLKFKPLIFGVFSEAQDFSSGTYPLPYSNISTQGSMSVDAWSDSTYIYLSYANTADTPSKLYYRIYGFEPSNSYATASPTSKHANDFILNTDYNYCKLKEKGVIDYPTDYTIQHKLGYIPQVLVWHETAGSIYPIWVSYPYDSGMSNVKVTDQSVIITGMERAHYRIYYDEA